MKLAAAWLVAGCGASINAFDATPHHACVGDTVTITWNVTGSASLALTPPSTEVPDGDVASTGTKLFHPQASTTIVSI